MYRVTYSQRVQRGVPARDHLEMAQCDIDSLGFVGLGEFLRETFGEDLEVRVPGGDRQFSGDAVGDRDWCGGSRHVNRRHW